MARLHWRVLFESIWSPEMGRIAHAPFPKGVTGHDKIAFYKSRNAAQQMLKTLFPADEPEEA